MKTVLTNIAWACVCLFIGMCTGCLAFFLIRQGSVWAALGSILIIATLLVVAVVVLFF